ncbi:unnamed protein product [Urochloa decumbens]|uniref:Uncharacterized protein n=1 Tax=Urochloa decumbens TaxID=240449 RepID=A0ABC9BP86_9POAL
MSSPAYQDRPAAAADSIPSRGSKRPRRQRTVADDAAPRDDTSPWASLHEDLISLIAWRVLAGGDLLDYVRFRAACRHWRSSAACPRGCGIADRRFHPRRWMLFPEGHGLHPGHGKLRGHVRFFNLSTGDFVQVGTTTPLPASSTLSTGDILDFPPLNTLLSLLGEKWHYFRSIGAASINVSADGVISVMIVGSLPAANSKVVFATSRDQQWRVSSWYLYRKFSPLSFQGKLYAVCDSEKLAGGREVLEIDPPRLEGTKEPWVPQPRSMAKCPILVVARSFGKPLTISVYRLADLMLGRNNVLVTGIGGDALFMGYSRNLCVRSKAFPTIVG